MNSIKCPNCNLVNFSDSEKCKKCGIDLNIQSNEDVVEQISPSLESAPSKPIFVEPSVQLVEIKRSSNTGEMIVGILWSIYFIYLFVLFGGFSLIISNANGAPQEASISALTLVLTIIPYCGLRALTSITKLFQGK